MSNLKGLKNEIDCINIAVKYFKTEIDILEAFFNGQAAEIKKLNSIIDELRDENERLKREAKRGEA